MTLNHSKTWPVSTMAVVQLRVNPNGRTYSTFTDRNNEENRDVLVEDNEKTHETGTRRSVVEIQDSLNENFATRENVKSAINEQNTVVLPLSKRHVELFTKMSNPHLKTTIRTDTVSTILEQDSEHDYERCEIIGKHEIVLDRFEISPCIRVFIYFN